MAAADDAIAEENSKTSKWEAQSPETTTEMEPQRNAWTTSHWQTTGERAKLTTNVTSATSPSGLVSKAPKVDAQASGSVLQRLRMAEHSESIDEQSLEQPVTSDIAGKSDDTLTVEANVSKPPATETTPSTASTKVAVTSKKSENSPEQPKKLTVIRGRSSSSSSSSADSSASSSSSGSSTSHSCSRSRSARRRSISPFARSLRRRDDFSDSRSRGRGSYYGRYSPISRSRYSRSRSRSFSTYRSTIRSGYSSNRGRRRSWSRSRSRSYSGDSRSPSSRWAGDSSHRHRRGKRAHRYSGFRRPSSSRSRSSSRSYSSSPRRR